MVTPASIILAAIILATSIIYHANALSGNTTSLGLKNTVGNAPDVNPVEPSAPADLDPQFAAVNTDGDPVLGDPNAPVTLIEFSDYECPFCQRHAQNTMPEIVKNWVDTGKVKMVFRDLPLSFHDPMATKAANAANCVRDQVGDAGYYTFHDLWFENTAGNGSGVSDDKMNEFASTAGADVNAFKQCVADERFVEEVQSDLADASAAGASATPSFFVGESTENGEINGEMIVGAQPYSTFEQVISKYLK